MLRQVSCRRFAANAEHMEFNDQFHTSTQFKAIVFGGASQVAMGLSGLLGMMSASVTFPVRTSSKWVEHIKLGSTYRDFYIPQYIDFDDKDIIRELIADHDIVINTIGAPAYLRNYEMIYDGNVNMTRRIAEACAESPTVKRFIHLSAVGADPHSPSTRLSTKWLGEQEAKNAYPDVTIIRPCNIFGDYDNFVNRWAKFQYFFDFMPIVNEGTELRQPINFIDVAQCVVNAIKMSESIGKTYEVGGPYHYTQAELFEIMYNKMQRLPKLKSFPYSKAANFMSWLPHNHGTTRWVSFNDVVETQMDLCVSPDALSCADLYLKPVSFPQNLRYLVQDHMAKVELTQDEVDHGWFYGNDRRHEP